MENSFLNWRGRAVAMGRRQLTASASSSWSVRPRWVSKKLLFSSTGR